MAKTNSAPKKGRYIDLAGQKFGKLTAIERIDHITAKGNVIKKWKCECDCGSGKEVLATTTELRNGSKKSCGCVPGETRSMSKEDVSKWDELYQYVRKNLMGYDDEQSLSTEMVLRLKGLRHNKHYENRKITDTANYSYEIILMTCKFCRMDIERGLRGKTFRDEMNKLNYIAKIIENNLNTVYVRMQNAEKSKEKTMAVDVSTKMQEAAEVKTLYKPSKRKTPDALKNMW